MHLTRTLMSIAAAVVSAVSSFAVNGAEDPEIKELSDGSTVAIFRNTSAPYTWPVPPGVSEIRYLVVGGGGGGGAGIYTDKETKIGGGGGAGGLAEDTVNVTAGTVLAVSVGVGGAGGTDGAKADTQAQNGGESSISVKGGDMIVSVLGGGAGGDAYCNGHDGACGGGAGYSAKVAGVGSNGGGKGSVGGSPQAGSGGGMGGDSPSRETGGPGVVSSITDEPALYAAGGFGAGNYHTKSYPGADGTGNGGDGGNKNSGCNGGSGIVILRYKVFAHVHEWGPWVTNVAATCTMQGERQHTCVAEGCSTPPAVEQEVIPMLPHHFVGGKCTMCGKSEKLDPKDGYTVERLGENHNEIALVFTNVSDTITWSVPEDVTSIQYLVVGGGGGGGYGGGGGGYALEDTASVQPGSVLTVSVGAGGAGGADGANGTRGRDSSLSGTLEVTAEGGGYGGGVDQDGGVGGCGGGGAKNYSGGSCTQGPSGYGGTGGGTSFSGSGAGVTGRNQSAKEKMSEGGAGLVSSITGAEVEYGKGGQGQTTSTPVKGTPGADGSGTGGGGSRSGNVGAKGGDGVVILRYATAQRSRGIMLIFN